MCEVLQVVYATKLFFTQKLIEKRLTKEGQVNDCEKLQNGDYVE